MADEPTEHHVRVSRLIFVCFWLVAIIAYSGILPWFGPRPAVIKEILTENGTTHVLPPSDGRTIMSHVDVQVRNGSGVHMACVHIAESQGVSGAPWVMSQLDGDDPDDDAYANHSSPLKAHQVWLRTIRHINERVPELLIPIFMGALVIAGLALTGRCRGLVQPATALCILTAICVHVAYTYAQGGLVVAPIGVVFGTAAALLLTHVFRMFREHKRWQFVVYCFFLLLFTTGSLIADHFAQHDFSEGTIFLLRKAFGLQPLYYSVIGFCLGGNSIFVGSGRL